MDALHEQWSAIKTHIDGGDELGDFPETIREVYPYLRSGCKRQLTRYILEEQNEPAFEAIRDERPALHPTPASQVKSWAEERKIEPVDFLLDHPDYLSRCFGKEEPSTKWQTLMDSLATAGCDQLIERIKRCFQHGFPDRTLTPNWSNCLKKGLRNDNKKLVRKSLDELDEYSDDLLEDALFNAQKEALRTFLDELDPERFADGTYRLQRRLGRAAKDYPVALEYLSGTDLAVTVLKRLIDNKQLGRPGPKELFDELIDEMTDQQCRSMGPILFMYYPCELDERYLSEMDERDLLDRPCRGDILKAMLINHVIGISSDVERLKRLYEHGFSINDLRAVDGIGAVEALAENPEALDMVLRRDSLDEELLRPILKRAAQYRPSLRLLVERHDVDIPSMKPLMDEALTVNEATVQYLLQTAWDQVDPEPLYRSIRETLADPTVHDEAIQRGLVVLKDLLEAGHYPEDLRGFYQAVTSVCRNNPDVPGCDRALLGLLYGHELYPPRSYIEDLRTDQRDDLVNAFVERLPGRARRGLNIEEQ